MPTTDQITQINLNTDNSLDPITDATTGTYYKGLNKNTLDTVDDLIGYLVLLKIAFKKEKNETNSRSTTNSGGKEVT